jgi:hypothetical protein
MNSQWLSWLNPAAIAGALLWLALLSRRLGKVTHAPPHYIGLFVAAALVGASAVLRIVNLWLGVDVDGWWGWALLYNGLPALGVTVGLVFAWRYWSWLFAERD